MTNQTIPGFSLLCVEQGLADLHPDYVGCRVTDVSSLGRDSRNRRSYRARVKDRNGYINFLSVWYDANTGQVGRSDWDDFNPDPNSTDWMYPEGSDYLEAKRLLNSLEEVS